MQNFVGAPDEKTKLGRPKYRNSIIIETDRKETGKAVELIAMSLGREQWFAVVNTIINLLIP
jgi:hypothetical protein